MQQEKIVIIDFGSQVTQLIARRVRECGVYAEIMPYTTNFRLSENIKGIILSGGPSSVNEQESPKIGLEEIIGKIPILGICYGAQFLSKSLGGTVVSSNKREYGRATIHLSNKSQLFEGFDINSPEVWMSHSDTISKLPENFIATAYTDQIPVAAFENPQDSIFALQFHPEVVHSQQGKLLLENFVRRICKYQSNWTPANFVSEKVSVLQQQLGKDKVLLGLSGGVDSSVAALLLHKAIGKQLIGIFIDNGLLRKGEFEEVLESYHETGLQVVGVDARKEFYEALAGISDPEQKRKTIGRVFVEIFDREAQKLKNIKWLAQGTIYPDVIESISVNGPSATIKSHHNVGGLPEKMKLKIVEPLRLLFKDEVRKVGAQLNLNPNILNRHPFPGPGLAIRILGDITKHKVELLQQADKIFIDALKKYNLYNNIWQAGVVLLPVKSVGVMGDERSYEEVVALRAVHSLDGMTADWVHLPYDFLADVSNQIINQVKGINRVVYDISSKPPATIEWE